MPNERISKCPTIATGTVKATTVQIELLKHFNLVNSAEICQQHSCWAVFRPALTGLWTWCWCAFYVRGRERERETARWKDSQRNKRYWEKERCGCQVEMRCQHANSNLPWMLNTVHLYAINSTPAVTMVNSCAINSPNPSLKGNKRSLSLCFSRVCLSIFLPPPCFPSLFFSLSLYHPSILSMLLHNISSTAFTFNSQRSWGRTEAGFRHNCQSTYPPTYCWLQSLTVPWKHTFPCIYVLCFPVDVCGV